MRRFFLFLIALGLGSLAVVGQEPGDPNAALKERIDQLSAELSALVQARGGEQERQLVLRSYDVSDLCSPIRDEAMSPTNLQPSDYARPEVSREGSRRPAYEVDTILELMRNLVAPESWDTVAGAEIQPRVARIFVNQLESVHRLIPPLLNQLRGFLDQQVVVDIVALPLTDAAAAILDESPRELTGEEAQRLLALGPLGRARVVGFDGQQLVQRNGSRLDYVADYDVEIAQEAALGVPVRATLFRGFAVQVRACLDRRGNGAVLHARLERTEVEEPLRSKETRHGPVDLPVLKLTRVQTSLWVPLRRTVVLGAGSAGDEGTLFLATVRRVRAK